jgi:hypothetical protein
VPALGDGGVWLFGKLGAISTYDGDAKFVAAKFTSGLTIENAMKFSWGLTESVGGN